MNNTAYETALQKIREAAFALHELVLYLDTHPGNRKALSLYKTYKKKYDEAELRLYPRRKRPPVERRGLICGHMRKNCNTP